MAYSELFWSIAPTFRGAIDRNLRLNLIILRVLWHRNLCKLPDTDCLGLTASAFSSPQDDISIQSKTSSPNLYAPSPRPTLHLSQGLRVTLTQLYLEFTYSQHLANAVLSASSFSTASKNKQKSASQT
ncbi:MAG: hypothetical protein WBL95_19900 [Microcoleus sp.]